jgi:phosphatidylserine/phosphatidylglycerophosphate/cardiolipin synthase-like enzyme
VVSPATESGVLIDGRDYFREFHRAASGAESFVLAAGWQFDSDVALLCDDDREAGSEVRLLPFLRALCKRKPHLRVHLLCWSYSPAYFFAREWLQDVVFNWTTPPNLVFRFDDRHAIGASHHQKFAVIDGAVGFVGSMDLCHGRWDEREHRCADPRRERAPGGDYGPYHEVNAYVRGPIVAELVETFCARWRAAGRGELELPPGRTELAEPMRPTVRLHATEAGLSRTAAKTIVPEQPDIREIEELYVAAIAAAKRSIYLENQYFGSSAVFRALRERLRDASRGPLTVVMIYPRELHTPTEEVSMGASQTRMFRALARMAKGTPHAVGIYCSVSREGDGEPVGRYIHSKVLIVDDRFLSIGSANTNNRSMGLDTELNVSWEAADAGSRLSRSIRRTRIVLLAEHAGCKERAEWRRLADPDGLVETLDRWARDGTHTLEPHPMSSALDESPLLAAVAKMDLDPDHAVVEDAFEDLAPRQGGGLLKAGVRRLRYRWKGRRRVPVVAVDPPSVTAKPPSRLWVGLVRVALRFGLPALAVAVLGAAIWLLVTGVRWALDGSG